MKKQNNEEMIDFLGYALPSYPAGEHTYGKNKGVTSPESISKGSNDKKSGNHNKGNGGLKTWK